jgi:hypothetical protein
MLDYFFGWLRRGSRDAVLNGVADAAEELTPDSPAVVRLRALLGLGDKQAERQLAPAVEDEPAGRKKRQ